MQSDEESSAAANRIHIGLTGCHPIRNRERTTLMFLESALDGVAFLSGEGVIMTPSLLITVVPSKSSQ